jgi:2-desacetyl-2-hydroxyethyl bacteriochlorophyllide A dehydrogenase
VKAAVAAWGKLSIETVADPSPAAGQVVVAPIYTGICGSDLRSLEATVASGPSSAGPLIPGHEFSATIVDHGPGIDRRLAEAWPVGSLVCANPFTGNGWELVGATPARTGALAELMVLDTGQLLHVPEGMAPELAALTEPVAVALHAVNTAIDRSPDGPFVVVGCGPIGLGILVVLRALGRGPIVASDPSPERRKLAAALGADVVVSPGERSPFGALAEIGFEAQPASHQLRASPSRPVVFECVGRPGMLQQLLEQVPAHSHLVVAGVSHEPETVIPVLGIAKEIAVDFVLAYRPDELALSLAGLADGSIDGDAMVTATFDLSQAQHAVDALQRAEQAKVLVMAGSSS